MIYEGKNALVLGLGESGLAMALWLARSGARVRVADTREAPERLPALRAAVPDADFVAGPFGAALLEGVDFVAVSPGLAPYRELKEIAPAATAAGMPVWGEIELFAQALEALEQERGYTPKVIAITGTNGKTTVTTLVGQLCERAGKTVRVAGNISPAALDVLREVIDAGELPEVWVLELSSFQLQTTFTLEADAATVLNVTQDHLDWHGDMPSYAAAKHRIFAADTVRVLNRDDATVMRMASATGHNVTFGIDAPTLRDDFGLNSERGVLWLATAVPAEEEGEPKKRKKNDPPPPPVECMVKNLMPADALQIRGVHNAANALAALALCRAIDLPLAPLLHGLREYRGQPHRVELVSAINGVEYYDDSKGTNVGATVAALNGLGRAFTGASQRLVVIMGGDGKGQDFAPLAEPVSRYVRAVMLIGRDAPQIRAALEASADLGYDIEDCGTDLPQAVKRAGELAQAGDAVLLSPACASMDMFKNYAHRAQVFIDTVREIALDAGQEL
ncbi:UDP-N-acetylmuramoyl-L-alanine--D-glutamate ligase [Duganella sp. BJB488]|uniref:UDP-N-acetylmuramoyl-L-alanine--D-glutamate ligase n=1 Tax=unclassified Duganella TaxID=2636909 RepID=UPI000E34E4BF|nr:MULTISPECIES: UDP-N-acetylmuramoyl-L-alanine--D-glutamate ligase [unclassified Duganella]RFP22934.1 UDP-N-acetylmuramoyl-L-alanine--D-glutamate ligase [Duganella sp. BJB489]RFP24990.1 UDP-N-acetylmuramoyl-L-alanine--D-glutamate ligase [Duganella sp. BJB488]RFP33933.1 UDP-N-acetylmuramoyl-L-alanine--D-glutamate ligase [Duganella sp. BJB480]